MEGICSPHAKRKAKLNLQSHIVIVSQWCLITLEHFKLMYESGQSEICHLASKKSEMYYLTICKVQSLTGHEHVNAGDINHALFF